MSQTDDSAAVTPTEHPRVFYKSPTFDKTEFELAKALADGLEAEWRVIVTMDSFRPHSILYRIDAASLDLDFALYRIDIESRILNFRFSSVRAYGVSDIENGVRRINLGYGVLDAENAIRDLCLEMYKAVQTNAKRTGFTVLYEADEYEALN
jgi:hypothetical protein